MQQPEYQNYIEQLIPVFGAPDFELTFEQVMANTHISIHASVRAELKRLMTPCKKGVDLREIVQEKCHQYLMNGYTHWLNTAAITAYNETIEQYGCYTIGVWEKLIHLQDNLRVLTKERATDIVNDPDDELFNPKTIYFGDSLNQDKNLSRMSTRVTVLLSDGNMIHNTCCEISSSGTQIKVPAKFAYTLDQIINVHFSDFAEKTKNKIFDAHYPHKILGILGLKSIEKSNNYLWLRLKTVSNHEITPVINQQLNNHKNRIQSNKEDQIARIRIQGYEHCYLKHTNSIPLFFSKDTLKYAILTDHNESLWKYWHNEKNQLVINQLLRSDRIQCLTKSGLKTNTAHFYSFKHEHEDREFFYSMTSTEGNLQERRLFWHIGAKRKSWKVVRLSMFELEKEDKEHLLNVAPEMEYTLEHLTHIGVLTEISLPKAQKDYLSTNRPHLTSDGLNNYRQATTPISQAHALYFDSAPRRTEPRFSHQTSITLYHPKLGSVIGNTLDISASGLSIQLNEPMRLNTKSDVKITFNYLQSLDAKSPLSDVSYHVLKVSPNNRCIHLRIDDSLKTSASKAFLERLIQYNIKKLAINDEQVPSMGMLSIMHRLLLNKLTTKPFFIEKYQGKFKARYVGANTPICTQDSIWRYLGDQEHLNLNPIFKKRMHLLLEPLENNDGQRSNHHECYLAIIIKDGGISTIYSRMLQEFNSHQERLSFIKKAKKLGAFLAVRISITTVDNPLSSRAEVELSRLSQQVTKQTEALQGELSNIIGCGELIDITNEVLTRFQLK